MSKVAIANTVWDSVARLPKTIQVKMSEFIGKFSANPRHPGLHYEKLNHMADPKIRSVRVNLEYRAIVAEQDDTYLLLWVDHHNEAYDWAKNKRCDVNDFTHSIQVLDTTLVETMESNTISDDGIFSSISDNELLKLGVSKIVIPFIRSVKDDKAFFDAKESLPVDVYENLSYFLEGIPVSEIIDMVACEPASLTLSDALDTAASRRGFFVVEGEEELKKMLEAPSEKWRVFLHPKQREIVEKNYSGPARAMGGAGTGKTVVAMHRTKQLAAKIEGNKKILFTTYTVNLAQDIEENLKKICTPQELGHIEVTNLDAWVATYFAKSKSKCKIEYDNDKLDHLWELAIGRSEVEDYSISFLKEEWKEVISSKDAFELEKYIRVPREGRGVGLDRRSRMKVWRVVSAYMEIMDEKGICDQDYATYLCKENVKEADGLYESVVVDEGQDLSQVQYRLIRALAGPEHKNDVFIVGDSHQRIYENAAVLSQCGINIRGRSSILRVNYRTTDEIRKYANSILKGLSFDDMDEGTVEINAETSLTHGNVPKVEGFRSSTEEFEHVKDRIEQLVVSGVSEEEICIVARTNSIISDLKEYFSKCGRSLYELKNNKSEDRSIQGVRCATMHRVKGLEFQYLFIVAANRNVLPLKNVVKNATNELEAIKREKCLVYVALTRARIEASVSYSGEPSEFINAG